MHWFFKLMNNSTFGKTMGNLIKRMNVRLVKNARNISKQIKFCFAKNI